MEAVQLKELKKWVAGICLAGIPHTYEIRPASTQHPILKELNANKIREEKEMWYKGGSGHYIQRQRKGGLAAVKLRDGVIVNTLQYNCGSM